MRHKLSQHDVYVLELAQTLRAHYDHLYTHVVVKCSKRRLGEVDILAERNGRVDLYEVKCSFRITKARKQLHRLARFFPGRQTQMFFYHGGSREMIQVSHSPIKGPLPQGYEVLVPGLLPSA